MKPYFQNVKKLEFVLTSACTGHCKHCSQGDHSSSGARLDPALAAKCVEDAASLFPLETVMTFGGEPLLHPEAVFAVHSAAKEMGVKRRQLITNGYFTTSPQKMAAVADRLFEAGVNDLLLSVDAFHQETIPLAIVKEFGLLAKRRGLPLRLQPAWLSSPAADNPYNEKTHAILEEMANLDLPVGEGNVIFCEGNAKKYLSEYFSDTLPENPYEEDPFDVRCLSVDEKGFLFGQSLYEKSLSEILSNYDPRK